MTPAPACTLRGILLDIAYNPVDRVATPHATRIEITRYGHAMAIPGPGLLARLGARERIVAGRLAFAHGDWSGYSIFEEAFVRGHLAGVDAAARIR